jgi:ribosomal protein L11 methyltransferase
VDNPLTSQPDSQAGSPPAWLEVSLTVDGELAEAAAEVLARFAPDGVALEATRIDHNPDDEGGTIGPLLRVCAYLPVDERLEETRQRLEEALWYLGRIRPLPEPAYRPIQDTDWAESWKANYRPIPVGERLVIVPAWLEAPPGGRIPVRIDPGMAFGTGTHPTTRLCLELLETYVRPGQPVIDIGCGSGILSVAAIKLGASQAAAVDIDPQAIPAAAENAQANQVAAQITLGVGSVAEVQAGGLGIRQAPLVLANILAPIILRLLDQGLADLAAPGGVLVLSGILEAQLSGQDGHPAVLPALERHGLRLLERRQIEDWVALVVGK